jgi:hypothetical protein
MSVINLHETRAAKLRAVAQAAFLVGERITGSESLARHISAMAVRRFSAGKCSPGRALAIARHEARALGAADQTR